MSSFLSTRSIVFIVLSLLLFGLGVGPLALHAQVPPDPEPPADEPAPDEPDPWLQPVEEMPPEEPAEEGIFTVDPSAPGGGETLDGGGGGAAAAAVDSCSAACTPGTLIVPEPTFRNCLNYASPVTPLLKRCASGPKFLCSGDSATPLLLIGASADVACHLSFQDAENKRLFCTQDNWKKVIDNLACHKLNKMRLWVFINGNPEHTAQFTSNPETSFPFLYDASKGHWRLDQRNPGYFTRLAQVVHRANERGIYVEITFFAPWEGQWNGDPPTIQTGPLAGANGKWCLDTPAHAEGDLTCTPSNLKDAGFLDPKDFVTMSEGRTATGLDTQIKRAREAQRNVIKWTLKSLWCYDKVFFEIANEPEASKVPGVTPAAVAKWQAEMIEALRAVEKPNTRHVIAIQPFTSEGASYAFGQTPPNLPPIPIQDAADLAYVDLVNGHYTTVSKGGSVPINLGAMQLARDFTRWKPVGFNETKISGFNGVNTTTGLPYSYKTGTEPCGAADPARAEAWEFLLNLGVTYDHWGYAYGSQIGQEVRHQMCYLKNFMTPLPLTQLKSQVANASPGWVSLQAYPSSLTNAGPYTYWAAAEPASPSVTSPTYLLYVHRDQRACIPTSSCGCEITTVPAFRGYHPSSTPALPQLTLKTLIPGSYTLSWLKPDRASIISSATFKFNSDQSCELNGGARLQPCKVTAPGFTYDIALWIRKPPGVTASANE